MRLFVNFIISGALLAVSALAAGAQTTGPLDVATTVPSSCTAPSANGSLFPSLNVRRDFDEQFQANVDVEIVCQGGAQVQDISFGAGNSSGTYSGATFRGMTNANGDKIFYGLAAATNSMESASGAAYQVITVSDPGATYANPNWPSSTPSLNMRAYITGAQLAGGTALANDATASVPDGTYNDTVVMTVTYSAQ